MSADGRRWTQTKRAVNDLFSGSSLNSGRGQRGKTRVLRDRRLVSLTGPTDEGLCGYAGCHECFGSAPCGRTTPRSTSRDDALSTAHRSSCGARRRPRSSSKIIVRARAERSAVSHVEPIRCIRCIRSIRIALRLWGRRGDATVSLARMPSPKTPLIPKFRDEPFFKTSFRSLHYQRSSARTGVHLRPAFRSASICALFWIRREERQRAHGARDSR